MLEIYESILHYLGLGLCHQLPERSFIYGGVQFPICARDTGIYFGIIVALAILFYLYRGAQRTGIPSVGFFVCACIAVLAMAVDGLSSYLGLRETTNFLRILSGAGFGVAMAPVIYSLLVDSLAAHRSERKLLDKPRELACWIGSIPLTIAIVYLTSPLLGPIAAGIQGIVIILVFWAVAMILVGLVPRYARTVNTASDLIEPSIWGLVGSALIILLCVVLQVTLTGIVL